MGTPTKRRKKNDHQPSNQPVRGLDFFFNKQQAVRKEQAAENDGAEGPVPGGSKAQNGEGVETEPALTDEEYALKLQAEFDEQDRLLAANDAGGQKKEEKEERKPYEDGDVKQEDDVPLTVGIVKEEDPSNGIPAHTLENNKATTSSTPTVNPFAAFGQKNTLSLQSATAEEDTTSYNIPFDESPMTFDPQKYIPALQKQWAPENGRTTYALLTQGFILINSTQSRIKIVDTLVNLLRTIIESDPQSLLPAVWLATNSIAPPYVDLELGLGGSAISKALKKVCGLDNASLKKLSDRLGDAGDVAFEAKKRQSMTLRKPKPLTIQGVFDGLVKIANTKGSGSVEGKQRIVDRLIQDARGAEESRYVVRTLVQHLRIGAVKTTMLIALSRAFLMSKPPGAVFTTREQADLARLNKQDLAEVYAPAEELVKACFARRPNYGDLVPALLEIGIDDELLLRCGLAMHIPMRPMLGGITRDLGEMLTKLEGRDFSCEYKYDGQRAQVHCDANGKVTIFSRHLEVMTDKYPDLVALIPRIRGEGISSFIMEGEVVAVDRETGDLKPFQTLANRARKDVVIGEVKVDVCLFAFDLMYLNNEELMSRPFRERRNLLRSLFIEIPNHFTWVKSLDATSADQEQVSSFFKQATDIKCEGIMVKVLDNLPNPDLQAELDVDATTEHQPKQPPPTPTKTKKKGKAKSKANATSADTEDVTAEKKTGRRKALLATYEPDKRLDSWLKVKKDYATHADTIDLIPVGGWHGSGRKNAWWSPILLACRNDSTGSLEVVTKCMSGFTDAFYKANRERYDPDSESDNTNTLGGQPSYVEYRGPQPPVWFEPQEVWEMAFADVTLSPTYTAAIGLVSEERGLSLRFPRFLRVREDKGLEEASSREFLAGLWRKQEARAPRDGERVAAVDDGYEE
jgi:DNA ligase-1